MSVLSKFLLVDYFVKNSLPYNCYELGHTFTPYCSQSSLIVASSVLRESLKMYSLLYFLTQIIFVRKFGYQNFKITLESIFRSTCFLTFNAFSTLSLFCFTRHLVGKFYLPIISHLPAMISSFLSLKIERENRRSALAFYCCNIAMETIIFGNLNVKNNFERLNKKHNIVQRKRDKLKTDVVIQTTNFLSLLLNVFNLKSDEFKKASMYIFGVTSIIYFIKLKSKEQQLMKIENEEKLDKLSTGDKKPTKKEHTELVCLVFKYLIGNQEFDNFDYKSDNTPDRSVDKSQDRISENGRGLKHNKKGFDEIINKLFSYSHITSDQCLGKKNVSNCLKSSMSCSLRGLAIGFLSNFTLLFAMHLKKNKFKLKQSLWSMLMHKENFQFSLLLGSFNGFYKLFNCFFHKIEEKKSTWHPIASSIVAICLPKILFGEKIATPNLNVTQYIFWKSFENWFWYFARAHQQKREQTHKKYLQIIEKEMTKRFNKENEQNDLNDKSINIIKKELPTNINLFSGDYELNEKINKLTINDNLQLNKLAEKLTEIESKQSFSIFNYISSDNLVSLIYSFSVSQLFYVAVMQPATLRGSYMKFLDRCTDNRLQLLNRSIIDYFGVPSSVCSEPFEPILDFKFTSRKFQEAVQIWTI